MTKTVVNAVGKTLSYSGASTAWFSAVGSTSILNGSAGNDSLWGSADVRVVMKGGAGDDIYYLYSADNTAEEGTGQGVDTISTWMSYTLPANIENLDVTGNGRHAFGNAADNIICGGSGAQTLFGGRGNDVLSGGAGADTFLFERGAGSDLITDFRADDTVRLKGYGLTSFEQVMGRLSQKGDNLSLDLGNGEKLVFADTRAEDLKVEQFDLSIDKSHVTRSFFDNFSTLWLRSDKGGIWDAKFPWAPESGGTLHTNGEQQWYVNPTYAPTRSLNPFTVNNGILTIDAAPVPDGAQQAVGGRAYTSGMLTTHSSFVQTYGYFEIRADMPNDRGAWPAFWLLPEDGKWPPELDVVEMRGQEPQTIHTTVHSMETGSHTMKHTATDVPTTDGFHNYGLLWTKDELVWYFDDVEIARAATPSDMHDPMYMVVNLAVGGAGGTPSGDFADGAQMKIDYVRAYSLDSDWAV
ncbi:MULTISPECIES: family 16 glycosylhydrolase [unclassified Rhizobium]|uniref:family 16 glycosylhydrolase n=1 Tax=unclassified Rhizobium TaxID=2613769 RepID=UPI000700DB42|nr:MULTISPECIES: family 16 glycosylhydrolase [unclassified Rhizobium]KQV38355.1 1,3-1,4-beta-glycanase [Rhizobium sp. Root1212]KRD31010.1 1,3-1,4-beta-glycanase [Rhizobium sp. Root268]